MDMVSSSTMSASTMTAEQARQKALELAQSRKQIDAELVSNATESDLQWALKYLSQVAES